MEVAMQFEQLSLPDIPLQSGRSLSSFSSNCNEKNVGSVYSKIDWLTVIFLDCSLNHVLAWLHHDDCVSDFLANCYEQSRGYDSVVKFNYNGILLETSTYGFYGVSDDESVFDVLVPRIRLELSGSALDYLRSCGINMDTYRFVAPELPEGGTYHFTRCDFAFDFVEYKPEFLDSLIDHINTHKLPSGRVPLASTNGAISYKLVTGGQKTVYLGSAQSDRMLRVYDKRLQYIDLRSGTYVKDNPYQNPSSWIRIEWQTRNKFANNLVRDSNLEFKHILKKIFEAFAFADGLMDGKHQQRRVVPFWSDLFPWHEIESRIIQNADFVKYKSAEERLIDNWRNTMIPREAMVYTLLGPERYEYEIRSYLEKLQNDPNRRRYLSFLHKLNELPIDLNRSDHGLFNLHGKVDFKL